MSSEQPPEYTALAVQLIAKRGAAGAKAMLDYLEHNYADPAARLEALGLTLQQIDAAPEPEPVVQLPPLVPASGDRSPRSPDAGIRVSENSSARKALPSRLDDPGLTAVTDSGLPPLIGYAATAVWLCLLRHANGRLGRLVKRRCEESGKAVLQTKSCVVHFPGPAHAIVLAFRDTRKKPPVRRLQ